jgi:hypothetical protein
MQIYTVSVGGCRVSGAQFRVRINELGAQAHPSMRGKVFYAHRRWYRDTDPFIRVLKPSQTYGWLSITYCADKFEILPIVDLPIKEAEPYSSMHQPVECAA